jgi:hypothetical protein
MKQPLLLLLLLLLFACADDNKNNVSCNVENPVEDLEWLRNELDTDFYKNPSTVSDSFVYQALYFDQPVFYFLTCCPVCNMAPPSVRACSGEVIGSLSVDIDSDNLKNQQVIWRTHNGVCP